MTLFRGSALTPGLRLTVDVGRRLTAGPLVETGSRDVWGTLSFSMSADPLPRLSIGTR